VAFHGNDYLDGEAGNDSLWGYGGNDELVGGTGDDRLEGDSATVAFDKHGDDYLDGGDGADTLLGDGGADTLFGGAGNDELHGDAADVPLANQGGDYLEGEAGDDYLSGYGGDDELAGGAGDDILQGGEGKDTLEGGNGIDLMEGGAGDDVYVFSTGDAPLMVGMAEGIVDTAGKDTLRFGAGIGLANITASRANADDLLLNIGTDRLLIEHGLVGAVESFELGDGKKYGYSQFVGRTLAGQQVVITPVPGAIVLGGTAADTLAATGGGATLSGGPGNDTLSATGDNNRILYAKGDGSDRVATGGTGNVLGLGPGIAATDLKLKLGSLALQIGDDPNDIIHFDSFDLANALTSPPFDRIEFEPATDSEAGITLTYAELLALGFDIAGSAGNDTLTGTSVSDRIDGGAGDDSLTGGGGSDIYQWGTGGGRDTIDNTDASVGTTDTLRIGGEADVITAGQLVFAHNGNDLIVRLRGATDQVTILNHYAGAAIDAIEFAPPSTGSGQAGEVWTAADIEAHVTNELSDNPDLYNGTAGNDAADGLGGNDTLNGLGGDDVLFGGAGMDTLNGGAGNDTLDGGLGYDELRGETGNDTYRFGRDSGMDSLFENDATAGNVDTVEFAADVQPDHVGVSRNINHLYLTIKGRTDKLSVVNHFVADAYRIEQVRFGTGAGATVWDAATLAAMCLVATEGADTLIGGDSGDVIDALGGSDTVDGQGGNDTLNGGAGIDSLTGGAGDDMLNGGTDNDTLKGGSGDDGLDGGAGNDVLHGETGNDTYRFGRGSGQDVIYDYDVTPGNVDTVEFAADVLPEHVSVVRSVGELVLTIKGTTDKLRLLSYFNGDAFEVEQVRFGSGPAATVWDEATLLAQSLIATEGADSLMGGGDADVIDGLGGDDALDGMGGKDTLAGGTGKDTLTGGLGGDTYLFARGGGADTIIEAGTQAGDIDTIEFAAGIRPDDVIVNRVSAGGGYYGFPHLRLDLKRADGTASTDSILVKNFFLSQDGANRIEQVRFAGSQPWDAAFLDATVASGTADADSMSGDALSDNFYGLGGNDTLSGYGGNDLLVGGAGNDMLYGGLGNDTYRFGRGDGVDTVSEVYQSGGTDTLELGPGILAENVSLYAADVSANDGRLVVVLDDSPTQLTVSGFFAGGTGRIERIVFADTSQWDAAAIDSRVIRGTANTMVGGPGDDSFVVDHYADRIAEDVNQGTDSVRSKLGWTLGANLENLTLTGPLNVWATGNELNNVITGNTGNNTLDGRLGADTLIGGKGDDTYYVSPLYGDTVTELVGEGVDLVIADYSYILPANVENLTMNSGYIGRVESLGNELDNLIIGRWGVSGDTLDGRGGNDTLKGGAGDDSYRFAPGGGADSIVEVSGIDQIVFDTGILAAGVTAVRTGSLVKLAVSANDSISFAETAPGQYAIEKFVFKVGPAWTATELRKLVNFAPTGIVGVSGTAAPGQILTAGNTLADADGLVTIDYQWQGSADGGVTWNDIDGAAGDSFALTEAQVGLQLRVVASYTDGHGTTESIASDASETITGGNTAPTITTAMADQVATEDAAFAFTVPAESFADIDAGDILGYTAAQEDGAALPAWLVFDATTRSFSGTPTSAAAGVYQVRVTATDLKGASVSDVFALDVANHSVGTATANNLVGTALRDFIEGLGGNDNLNGGAGADTLSGGSGNDTYVVDHAADVVIELAGAGTDVVTSGTASIMLSGNVENLTLTGSAAIDGSGNALDNVLTGNAGNNTLLAGDGNDTLSGGCGGVDTLAGGRGNDTYSVYFRSTQVVENEGEGTDTVNCTMPYTLAANVENLVLTGGAGNHIRGTGNAMDNLITGNAGNNTLDGKAGADTLTGGLGNDAYLFGTGYGEDTIRENDATAGNADAARFLAGIAADQIWLRQAGNNLEASIVGTLDKLTLENWYLGSSYRVEQFQTADGKVLLDSRVENLVQAMAAFEPPAAGQTQLPPGYLETLAPLIAANWQ
jgi:Ca2+-binding RTX toxin-like protein